MSKTMVLGIVLGMVAVLAVAGAVIRRSHSTPAVVQESPVPTANSSDEARLKQFEQELARLRAEAAALEVARRAEDAAITAAAKPTVEEYLAKRDAEDRAVEARRAQLEKAADAAQRQAALLELEQRLAQAKEWRKEALREEEVRAQAIAAQAAVEAATARQREADAAERSANAAIETARAQRREADAAERAAQAAEDARWRSTHCTTNYNLDSSGRPYASTNCN